MYGYSKHRKKMVKIRREKLYPAFLFPFSIFTYIWASTLQNLLVRPAKTQIRLRIRIFVDRMCLLQPPGYPKRDEREPLPYWVDAQDDLSLCWSNKLIVGFVVRWLIYMYEHLYVTTRQIQMSRKRAIIVARSVLRLSGRFTGFTASV